MSRYILAALAFQAAVVRGQSLNDLPTCAQGCISGGNVLPSSCSGTDIACICRDNNFIHDQSCCIHRNCPESDISAATNFAAQLCAGVQVEISTAEPSDCNSEGSSTTTGTPTPTGDTNSNSEQSAESSAESATPTPNAADGREGFKGKSGWNIVAILGAVMAVA